MQGKGLWTGLSFFKTGIKAKACEGGMRVPFHKRWEFSYEQFIKKDQVLYYLFISLVNLAVCNDNGDITIRQQCIVTAMTI
jgi:hypothetical protein